MAFAEMAHEDSKCDWRIQYQKLWYHTFQFALLNFYTWKCCGTGTHPGKNIFSCIEELLPHRSDNMEVVGVSDCSIVQVQMLASMYQKLRDDYGMSELPVTM